MERGDLGDPIPRLRARGVLVFLRTLKRLDGPFSCPRKRIESVGHRLPHAKIVCESYNHPQRRGGSRPMLCYGRASWAGPGPPCALAVYPHTVSRVREGVLRDIRPI